MRTGVTGLFLLCVVAAGSSPDAPLVIIADGHSAYDIVIPGDALPTTRLAGDELREYVGRACGVALDIVPAVRPGRRGIHIQHDGNLPRNGFVIHATDHGDIELRGCDGPGVEGRVDLVRPVLRGTCHAVYEFLERFAGVRWYWNEPLGEIIPELSRLTVPRGADIRQTPAFEYRALAYGPVGTGDGEWARRNRLGADRGMHHGHYVHRLLKVGEWARRGHPEFASLIEGRRKTEGEHVCLSNPEVVRIIAEESARAFEKDANLNMMSISLPDGHDFCSCPNCSALDAGSAGKSRTSRVLHFYNQVAELLDGKHGDRKLGAYVYSEYLDPPAQSIPIHPMLTLVVAPNSAMYLSDSVRLRHSHELNAAWAGLHDQVFAYDTLYLMSLHWGLPAPIGGPAVELVRSYAKTGIRGAYLYIAPTWEAGGADAYLLTRLLWNPQADVDRTRNEYFGLLYQGAAEPVRRYFEIAESCWRSAVLGDKPTSAALSKFVGSLKPTDRRLANLVLGYAPHLVELEACVKDAESRVDEDDRVRRRVERIRDNFVLTDTTVRGLQAAIACHRDPLNRASAVAELKKLGAERDALMVRLSASYGKQLVDWLRAEDERSDSPLRRDGRLRKSTPAIP